MYWHCAIKSDVYLDMNFQKGVALLSKSTPSCFRHLSRAAPITMTFNSHDRIVLFETKSHEEQSAPANISPTDRRGFLLAEANYKFRPIKRWQSLLPGTSPVHIWELPRGAQ